MRTFKIIGGDLDLGTDGVPTQITGRDKLVQDVFEVTIVSKNLDGYGAGIGDMIASITSHVPASVSIKLMRALEYYQYLQKQQYSLSEEEKLIELVHITSRRIPGSRTDYEFDVLIRNGASTGITKVCVYTRPALR